jgi:hypothetical protein
MKRSLLTFLLLSLAIASIAQLPKQLQFREETYEFGRVPEDKGPVTHEFVFTNNSSRPVMILNVQASCGCTTPGWSKEPVAPGKTGFIQASFNPKGRPGVFTKSLTVTTDLEANPVTLQIKGEVIEEAKTEDSGFTAENGSLKFRSASFNMGKVLLKDEFVGHEFPFINGSSKPVTFTGKFVHPKHIKVEVQPLTIAAGGKGIVKIRYNGKLKNQYGFQSDNVELHTNDEVNPVKSYSVFATLEDYFPQITTQELAKAPQLKLASSSLDFGKVTSRASVIKEIEFTNTGKKELNLKSLQGNCVCIKATANKTTIKPGETSKIKVEFDPAERKGTQTKAVTIYSNDPQNPVQRLTLTAYIEG